MTICTFYLNDVFISLNFSKVHSDTLQTLLPLLSTAYVSLKLEQVFFTDHIDYVNHKLHPGGLAIRMNVYDTI